MDINELKNIITTCVNDIYFIYNNKKCGVTSQVEDYMPVYEMWYGKKIKQYHSIDKLLKDPFFDGKSLTNILKCIEIFIA